MGEIVGDAAEYATVERLSEMLVTANEPYKATEAYALFTAILCWVMQRAGTVNQLTPADLLAQSVKTELMAKKIAGAPWYVATPRNVTAYRWFRDLRNAVAHGDARRIRPVNEHQVLRGYLFELRGEDGAALEEARLLRADMQRLGVALAELYCSAMAGQNGNAGVAEQAKQIAESEV